MIAICTLIPGSSFDDDGKEVPDPATDEARQMGCICPDEQPPEADKHAIDTDCPVHQLELVPNN